MPAIADSMATPRRRLHPAGMWLLLDVPCIADDMNASSAACLHRRRLHIGGILLLLDGMPAPPTRHACSSYPALAPLRQWHISGMPAPRQHGLHLEQHGCNLDSMPASRQHACAADAACCKCTMLSSWRARCTMLCAMRDAQC
jgi:hypothetical protein